jgi:hypothetical protein
MNLNGNDFPTRRPADAMNRTRSVPRYILEQERMNLELHHVFILVEPEADVADLLVSIGMNETAPNTHPGQGSSNRRFFFSNGALELLYIHDEEEANSGPGRNMQLTERASNSANSPFGVILSRKDNSEDTMPFSGWNYKPDYFESWSFHIGENSLLEPLCIYMPFIEPGTLDKNADEGSFKSISQVNIQTPISEVSSVLDIVNNADRINISRGKQHLMEIVFDDNQENQVRDLRPELPLIVFW